MTKKTTEPAAKQLTAKEKRELREKGLPTSAAEATNMAAMNDPSAVKSAAGEKAAPQVSGGKVIVACRIGVAYIDLQLTQPEEVDEQTQTGSRRVTRHVKVGNVVRIRGTAYPNGPVPRGFPSRPIIVDGAALTLDVDEDFWNEWVRQNARAPYVINGMIFAHKDMPSINDMAKERKGLASGLDPINPLGDPRTPRSTNKDIGQIQPGDAKAST